MRELKVLQLNAFSYLKFKKESQQKVCSLTLNRESMRGDDTLEALEALLLANHHFSIYDVCFASAVPQPIAALFAAHHEITTLSVWAAEGAVECAKEVLRSVDVLKECNLIEMSLDSVCMLLRTILASQRGASATLQVLRCDGMRMQGNDSLHEEVAFSRP